MILAEKITEERKKNGWSQEELAEKLEYPDRQFQNGRVQVLFRTFKE